MSGGAASPRRAPLRAGWVFAPAMFALAPLLAFYAENVAEVGLSEMLVIMLAVAATLLLLAAAGMAVLRERQAELTLIGSALVFAVFNYGSVFDLLSGARIGSGQVQPGPRGVMLLLAGCVGAAVWLLRRRGVTAAQGAAFVTVVAAALVAGGVASVAGGWGALDGSTPVAEGTAALNGSVKTQGDARLAEAPDIYYVVLDGYAADSVLSEIAGHDNSAFTSRLRERGFYVAERAMSNYSITFLSLSSALNMRYVNDEVTAQQGRSRSAFTKLIQDSDVVRTLRAQGYRYVHVASGWGATDEAPGADVVHDALWNELHSALLKTTVFRDTPLARWHVALKHSDVNKAFTLLRTEGDDSARPTFVFAHIITPHAPYVFAADGSLVDDLPASMVAWDTRSIPPYVDQLKATNRLVMRFVDEVLDNGGRPAVIIVQGDHGTLFIDAEAPDVAQKYRQRHGVLNAMYLPDGGSAGLYPSISLVNTFRVVLNEYFDQGLALLPDRAYYSPYGAPYQLTEVTGAVHSAPGGQP